jgi:hypothetical protein
VTGAEPAIARIQCLGQPLSHQGVHRIQLRRPAGIFDGFLPLAQRRLDIAAEHVAIGENGPLFEALVQMTQRTVAVLPGKGETRGKQVAAAIVQVVPLGDFGHLLGQRPVIPLAGQIEQMPGRQWRGLSNLAAAYAIIRTP